MDLLSVCVCEQARNLWPLPGQEGDATFAGPLWPGPGEPRAPAGGPVVHRLRVPAESPAQRPADGRRRRRDRQRYKLSSGSSQNEPSGFNGL